MTHSIGCVGLIDGERSNIAPVVVAVMALLCGAMDDTIRIFRKRARDHLYNSVTEKSAKNGPERKAEWEI